MSVHTLADFRALANAAWPENTAQSWDRVGLVSGRDDQPVKQILLAVDAVAATVAEACDWQADLLFTHHPLLLRGVTTIAADTSKGSLLMDLIESKCALYAAHTNADAPLNGVSDVLATRFGLMNAVPIEAGSDSTAGIGRFGILREPMTLRAFAQQVHDVLPRTASGVRVAGDPEQLIHRVALCGGAGDSLLSHPAVRAADVYVTSDLRHHPAQESREQSKVTGGPALIDVSHWASESVWLEEAAELIRENLPGIEVRVSGLNTDPWCFAVN